jgi:hypothetical protein
MQCEAGKYNSEYGSMSDNACKQCDRGKYSSGPGN